jgi:hypothetical protein
MLLTFTYGMDSLLDREILPSLVTLTACQSRQRGFLDTFDSDDLNQIQTVSFFMHRMVEWAFRATSDGDVLGMMNKCGLYFLLEASFKPLADQFLDDLNGLYLFARPRFIFECYNKCSVRLSEGPQRYIDNHRANDLYIGFIVLSTGGILKERRMRVPNLPKVILDLIEGHGEADNCMCSFTH